MKTPEVLNCSRFAGGIALLFSLLAILSPIETAEDLRMPFARWAEAVEIQSLSADFTSVRHDGSVQESRETVRGTWRISLQPSARHFLKCLQDGNEDVCHWNASSGEGRQWTISQGAVRAKGTLTAGPPPPFGLAVHPSDFFFLIQLDRPVRRYLDMVEFEARRLGGTRYAYLLKNQDRQNIVVYILDDAALQPLIEMRSYVPPIPDYPARNPRLGTDIELPAGFKGLICFVRKRVLETTTKAGRQIPTRWTVEHALQPPSVHDEVSLNPETLRVNEMLGDEDFPNQWPDGTIVFDAVRGHGYSTRHGQPIDAEIISEASLELWLKEAGVDPAPIAIDVPAVTGCGANVLYLALRMLGVQPSLNQLAQELGIEVHQPYSSLASIARSAERAGRPAVAVSAGKEILRAPQGEPVLLHVKKSIKGSKEPFDHFILVEGYESQTDTVRVYDPPQTPYRAEVANVGKVWTGKALVFSGTSGHRLAVMPIWKRQQLWVVAGGLFFLFVVGCCLSKLVRKHNRATGSLLIVLGALLVGCEGRSASPAVRTRGPSHVDFGKVKRTLTNLSHTFEIENTGEVPVTIGDVSRSCSCMAVDFERKTLPPGKTVQLRVELETKLVVGKRQASALLRLGNGEGLLLSVEAVVEASYRAGVTPGTWVLLANTSP